MIKKGTQIEEITEKIAILKHEIESVGTEGLTNLNKHCEDFVMELLNLIYTINLQNLNRTISNYPGLDLGDRNPAVATAYQVTAIKKSEKVDDMLEKCIKYGHYNTFRNINVFILTDKQESYSIKTVTEPYFTFDPKVNIIDFNTILKEIQHLPGTTISKIHNFILDQLTYTLEKIKSNDSSTGFAKVIDVKESSEKTGMPFFYYYSCQINMNEGSFTPPLLYKKINEFYNDTWKKNLCPVVNPAYKQNITPAEIIYKSEPSAHGVSNHFFETSLKIAKNELIFENAEFRNNTPLLTSLNAEVGSLLSLLLFCRKMTDRSSLNIDLSITLESNAELVLSQQNSLLKLGSFYNLYLLHENKFESRTTILNMSNDVLFSIIQELVNSFVCEETNLGFDEPFVNIGEENIITLINVLRDNFGVAS